MKRKISEIEKSAEEHAYEPAPRDWPTSGPFQIDRSKYLIGEKIFMRINDIDVNDKGQIVLLRPLNDTHYSVYQTIPFDGMNKTCIQLLHSTSFISTITNLFCRRSYRKLGSSFFKGQTIQI